MRDRTSRVFLVSLLAMGVATGVALGCRSKGGAGNAPISSDSIAAKLPPLAIRADSKDLTFSYLTTDGGFQLVHGVNDVPYEARDVVRVWSEVSGDGIVGPWIYVADLRQPLSDGTYKVDVMSRDALDSLAAKRRTRGKSAPAGDGPGNPPSPETSEPAQKGTVVVTIYGASWCNPCHQAEAYLKSKKIPYVHKDIEEDEDAQKEMQRKLRAAGVRGGSIPVIDVAGQILVGFSADELDRALAKAGR